MISLFISNSNVANTSNTGSKISLSMNPAISLDPEKNITHQHMRLIVFIVSKYHYW